MKINGEITNKLIQIQKEAQDNSSYFNDNKFLLFSFALLSKKSTVMTKLFEELSFKKEEIKEYITCLKENELYSIDDEKLLNRTGKSKETKNFKEEVEEIISHLNTLSNRRLKINTTREKRITGLLSTGKFNVSDFKAVNLYFTKLWGTNPDMKKYLTPDTLYFGKRPFDIKLEEAREFFETYQKYQKEIEKLCSNFHKLVEVEIYPKHKLLASDIRETDLCKELPMQLQNTIVHWLEEKYSIEDIILTIEMTIESWSKNEEYKKHISISKILDSKFPSRFNVAKKLLKKKEGFSVKPSQASVSDWLNKRKKGEI